MLLGLILAIIFGTTRSLESEFTASIPHLKKEIRQNVSDNARKAELLTLLKAYEKTIKKSEKEKKKQKKLLDKTSADRSVSTIDFLKAYDEYFNSRERLLASLIDYRLLFQEQITEEELLQINENAIVTSKKERRQDVKQEAKAEEKLIKVFEDIGDIVVKHINDSTKTESVKGYLHDFETTIFELVDEARDLLIRRQMMVDNKNATREEIEGLFKKIGQLRVHASREFATLREEIINNTSEKEWKAINKELKVFLKS